MSGISLRGLPYLTNPQTHICTSDLSLSFQPYSSLTLALLMSKAAVWLQYGCNEARRSLRGDWKQTVEVEKWVGTGYSPLLVPEAFAGSCSCATAATVFQICVTCYACYCTFTKYAHCLQLNNYDCWLVICFFHNR